MRALIRSMRRCFTPGAALFSAVFLCGLYFISWCLIAHWSEYPGVAVFYR